MVCLTLPKGPHLQLPLVLALTVLWCCEVVKLVAGRWQSRRRLERYATRPTHAPPAADELSLACVAAVSGQRRESSLSENLTNSGRLDYFLYLCNVLHFRVIGIRYMLSTVWYLIELASSPSPALSMLRRERAY